MFYILDKQGRIHGRSRLPSSFLPAKKKEVTDGGTDGWTNGRTDGRTHPLIELWLKTKNDQVGVTPSQFGVKNTLFWVQNFGSIISSFEPNMVNLE